MAENKIIIFIAEISSLFSCKVAVKSGSQFSRLTAGYKNVLKTDKLKISSSIPDCWSWLGTI